MDTTESAQQIRQLQQELAETKQQLRVKDEQILELIKRLPEQTASPAKTNKKTKRQGKKAVAKKSKVETSFKPWNDPGDACFVLDGARVKIWNGDELTDLKLKSGSKTDRLLPMLSAGPLRKTEIKEAIGTAKTSPYDAVRDVNRRLNDKIKKLNIQEVPPNTAFIARDERTGHYYSTLPIMPYQEFEYG